MANAGVGAAHIQPSVRQGGQRAGGDRVHLRPRGALLFFVVPRFHLRAEATLTLAQIGQIADPHSMT